MNRRGIVLINVLILLMIMIFVAGAMVQLSLGRTVMVARHRTTVDSQAMAQSVRTMLEACIAGQDFATVSANPSTCNPPFNSFSSAGCVSPSGAPLCAGNGLETTTTIVPLSNLTSPLRYTFNVCWCDPAGAGEGALIITCAGSALAPCNGGCGCP